MKVQKKWKIRVSKFLKINRNNNQISNAAFWQLVGNTPLVRIKCLSEDLGIEVYGKAEFLNPGGSVKDRVAKSILEHTQFKAGDTIVEGTSGSTGISLSLAANCVGLKSIICLPDDQAKEKASSLRALGAEVLELPPSSITDPQHYVNAAKNLANSITREGGSAKAFFCDQFENEANFEAHYRGTGVEILEQTSGEINGFVGSCGTGGTLSGVAKCLKEFDSSITIVLVDPQGSALYSKIRTGVLYNSRDAEGHRTKRIFDTIVEGIGINRITRNLQLGLPFIDTAYQASDLECVHMSRYLLAKDGLFVGSSSALNCVGLVKAMADGMFKKGDTVVVMLCDSGVRHLSKFYNETYLEKNQLLPLYLTQSRGEHETIDPNLRPSIRAAKNPKKPSSVFDFVDL